MRCLLIVVLTLARCCFAEDPATLPPDIRPLAQEAKQHFERGRFGRAEKIYATIVAKHPESVWALSNLGVIRFRIGKLKAAEEVLRRAVRLAPEDTFSHRILGVILYSQGRYDEAVEHFKKAGDTSPAEDSPLPPSYDAVPIPVAWNRSPVFA